MRLRTGTISVVPSKLSQNPIHQYPENLQETSFVIIYEKNKHLLSSEGAFPMQRAQTAQFVPPPRKRCLLCNLSSRNLLFFVPSFGLWVYPKKHGIMARPRNTRKSENQPNQFIIQFAFCPKNVQDGISLKSVTSTDHFLLPIFLKTHISRFVSACDHRVWVRPSIFSSLRALPSFFGFFSFWFPRVLLF